MQANIAIIVAAFNRPQALQRLLNSLGQADYSGYRNIPLIISIDYSGNNDCFTIAEKLAWKHGEKKIVRYEQNQGLKKHILQCGDLCMQYDAVIILEDDLFVSAFFYDYAQQAYSFYKDAENVAGISLYNYKFNEIAYCPFDPITDQYDNYFLQVPCSWGQMWTTRQWQLFKEYLSTQTETENGLPATVALWPSGSSWKKSFFTYLIFSGQYMAYPRVSLTTNFGDIGAHYEQNVQVWQTPLLLSKKDFRFSHVFESLSVYDAFFELDVKCYNKLTQNTSDICIDLNGSKPLAGIINEYLISVKKCKHPIKKYPLNLYPYEINLIMSQDDQNIKEGFISFGKTNDFEEKMNVDRRMADEKRIFMNESSFISIGRNQVYHSREYKMGYSFLRPFRFLKRLLSCL